jgi:hypothetical protein
MADPTKDSQIQPETVETVSTAKPIAQAQDIRDQDTMAQAIAVEQKQAREDRSKVRLPHADEVRKPFTAILSSITVLTVVFLILTTGLRGITTIVVGRLQEAKTNHAALQGHIDKESHMRHTLEVLTESKLPSRIWESHTECLVRGIQIADVCFLGSDFYVDHEDVRNATMEWVKYNCDRLAFAPDIVTPMDVHDLARRWALASRRITHLLRMFKTNILDPMAKPMKSSIVSFLGQISPGKQQPYQNQTARIVTKGDGGHASKIDYDWDLPRYFRLIDCEDTPCKLVYMPPANNTSTSIHHEEIITKVEAQVNALYAVAKTFWTAHAIIDCLWQTALVFQFLALITLVAIEYQCLEVECSLSAFSHQHYWLSWHSTMKKYDRHFWSCLAIKQIFSVSIKYANGVDGLPVDFHVCSLLVGSLLLLVWLATRDESIPGMTHMFTAWEELSEAAQVISTHRPSPSDTTNEPLSPNSTSSPRRKKTVTGRVSSTTSLQEDLEAIRAEEKANRMLESTLDEIVNDEDSFKVGNTVVKRNGGMTMEDGTEEIDFKSVSDGGSDWSIVSDPSVQETDD